MAIKNLKNNTIFKAPKYLTEEQTNYIKDPVFFQEHSEKSNDEIKLLLSKNQYMKFYYRIKIYLKNSFLYESTGHFNYFFFRQKQVIYNINSVNEEINFQMFFCH